MTTMDDRMQPTGSIFDSPEALRAAFERQLTLLLESEVLGVYILVLANASYEPALFARLHRPLAAAFERWCARFDGGESAAVDAAVDDVAVFARLREVGFGQLTATRSRQLGPWQLQFNPLRAFRPPRMSHARVERLYTPFDPDGFHFDKPFLRQEILWEGELAGSAMRLLYNKFPFAESHGLLVPQPAAGRPQFLRAADHALIAGITRRLGAALPGVGFGYNAQGAFASVNHLHFQFFMRSAGQCPIESGVWRHNGGSRDYPLAVSRHADHAAAWPAIERLHAAGCSYNLLYRPDAVYLVPRAMQGSYRHSGWTAGFAWSEIAGAFTAFDANDFAVLGEADIDAELARLAMPAQACTTIC